MDFRKIAQIGFALVLGIGAHGCGGGRDLVFPGTPGKASAFVLAGDFVTGSFATIAWVDGWVVDPARPERRLAPDATARAIGGLVYVLERSGPGDILALDPALGFAPRWQCGFGTGGFSNPHDLVVVGRKGYVTLYDRAELLIIDPSPAPDCGGFVRGRIDLRAFADADGIPEMDLMASFDRFLYVTLQRLDRQNFFLPAAPGLVLVIDTQLDEVVNAIPLSGANPFAATKGLTIADGVLLVPEVGEFGVWDGGIERVDLLSEQAAGFLVTEAELGGDILDFVRVSNELAYAIVSDADFATSVVAFRPADGRLLGTLARAPSFAYFDIELSPAGELFLADRTIDRPGVRIFRAADGTELTALPLDVGLPPIEIAFLR